MTVVCIHCQRPATGADGVNSVCDEHRPGPDYKRLPRHLRLVPFGGEGAP